MPRSSEVLVRDRVKFRVGQIVYVAFSQDETEIGFAFPKEERAALVAARPGSSPCCSQPGSITSRLVSDWWQVAF